MSDNLEEWMTTRQAAGVIGIEYSTLMARIRKGKIKAEKKGWATLVHRDEVNRVAKKEKELSNAANKNMEKPAR